ncbi:MAG: hypothetical protein R2932_50360 [Caldilineaceae bacterium]
MSELVQRHEVDRAGQIALIAGHLIQDQASVAPAVERDVINGLHSLLAYPVQRIVSATEHTFAIDELAWSPDDRYRYQPVMMALRIYGMVKAVQC